MIRVVSYSRPETLFTGDTKRGIDRGKAVSEGLARVSYQPSHYHPNFLVAKARAQELVNLDAEVRSDGDTEVVDIVSATSGAVAVLGERTAHALKEEVEKSVLGPASTAQQLRHIIGAERFREVAEHVKAIVSKGASGELRQRDDLTRRWRGINKVGNLSQQVADLSFQVCNAAFQPAGVTPTTLAALKTTLECIKEALSISDVGFQVGQGGLEVAVSLVGAKAIFGFDGPSSESEKGDGSNVGDLHSCWQSVCFKCGLFELDLIFVNYIR